MRLGMRRLLAILVFGAAAAGATLAGAGLAVAPHVDPPGIARVHDHVLAAYRFPIFLLRLQERLRADQPSFHLESRLGGGLATVVLALLVVAAARLPRPSLQAVGSLAPPAAMTSQWRAVLPLAPPRRSALRPVPA